MSFLDASKDALEVIDLLSRFANPMYADAGSSLWNRLATETRRVKI